MNEKNLKDIISYVVSSKALDSSINELALEIESNGTKTSRKDGLAIINKSGFKTLNSFKNYSLKLVIVFAKASLKDNLI